MTEGSDKTRSWLPAPRPTRHRGRLGTPDDPRPRAGRAVSLAPGMLSPRVIPLTSPTSRVVRYRPAQRGCRRGSGQRPGPERARQTSQLSMHRKDRERPETACCASRYLRPTFPKALRSTIFHEDTTLGRGNLWDSVKTQLRQQGLPANIGSKQLKERKKIIRERLLLNMRFPPRPLSISGQPGWVSRLQTSASLLTAKSSSQNSCRYAGPFPKLRGAHFLRYIRRQHLMETASSSKFGRIIGAALQTRNKK